MAIGEESIILWLISGILAVAGIIAIAKSAKPDTKKVMNIFGAVALLLAVFFALWQFGILAGLGLDPIGPIETGITQVPHLTVTPQVTTPGTTLPCAVEDTTVTLSASDKYVDTATGGTHKYRINGNPALTVSNAGTFTASPGDQLQIMWFNGSKTSYFSKIETLTIPCKGTYSASTKLSNNGTLTTRIWNSNGVLIDGSINQSLGAGDLKSLKMELEGTYQKDYPNGAVIVLESNKTDMDDVILTQNGVELASATIPQSYSITYGAEAQTRVYLIPEVISSTIYTYSVTLDTDDTNAPGVDGSDVLITYYGKNVYTNEKTGGSFEGPAVDDEYNALTRTGTQTATLHVQ